MKKSNEIQCSDRNNINEADKVNEEVADCDNKTMVQPDVIVICDRDKILNHSI